MFGSFLYIYQWDKGVAELFLTTFCFFSHPNKTCAKQPSQSTQDINLLQGKQAPQITRPPQQFPNPKPQRQPPKARKSASQIKSPPTQETAPSLTSTKHPPPPTLLQVKVASQNPPSYPLQHPAPIRPTDRRTE